MKMKAHRRHDISDRLWKKLEPHLSGRQGSVGRPGKDNRLFINGVFWILRTGAPWRDLPPDYGHWKNVHRRFCRWRDRGIWEKLLEVVTEEPDYEWFMIDASHIKVHPHAAGAKGGNQDMSRTKGGSTRKYIWPWMRMVCRSELLLQKVPHTIAGKLDL
jgi:transposase